MAGLDSKGEARKDGDAGSVRGFPQGTRGASFLQKIGGLVTG